MEKITHNINALIHNRFDIEVRDAKTGELKQQAQAFNVICDALWTSLFGGNTYFSYILYGEGTGTPSASDTELFTRINSLSAGNEASSVDISTGVYSLRKQATIDETISVGKTITEIGIGYDYLHIVTHAMLQDMNGNPISITKTDTDIITFYATVFVHWNVNGYANGKIFMCVNDTSLCPVLAGNTNISSFSVSAAYGGMADSIAYGSKNVSIVRTLADKTLSFSGLRFAVGEANNTIYEFFVGPFFVDKSIFPASVFSVSGEAVGTGDGTTASFNTKFPISSNCKVYVDGVEQTSGVTIHSQVIPSTISDINSDNEISRDFYYVDDNGNKIRSSAYQYFNEITICRNEHRRTVRKFWIGGAYSGNSRATFSYILECSNDLQSWTSLYSGGGTSRLGNLWTNYIDLGQNYTSEYFRITRSCDMGQGGWRAAIFTSGVQEYGIVFDTPPAAGAVITADYIADCIPKDSDHVFDLGMTITLGEYVEP